MFVCVLPFLFWTERRRNLERTGAFSVRNTYDYYSYMSYMEGIVFMRNCEIAKIIQTYTLAFWDSCTWPWPKMRIYLPANGWWQNYGFLTTRTHAHLSLLWLLVWKMMCVLCFMFRHHKHTKTTSMMCSDAFMMKLWQYVLVVEYALGGVNSSQ